MKLALGISTVKGPKGRLHHVFRVLFAAETAVHLPFDQPAKLGTIPLVQLERRRVRTGVEACGDAFFVRGIGHVTPPAGELGESVLRLRQPLKPKAQAR